MSSQPTAQIQQPNMPYIMVPVRERNGLGVAGFLIAFIGLFIPTGIVALLGMLISLVALGKGPRFFAGLGVLTGLFGTVIWLVITILALIGLLVGSVVAVVFSAGAFIITQPEVVEVSSDMINVTMAVAEYEKKNNKLPEDVASLGLGVSTLTDPWGNAYNYQIIDADPGFDVISSGSDGEFDTDDDMKLSGLDQIWKDAFANFGSKMEELGEKLEGLEGTHVRFEKYSNCKSTRSTSVYINDDPSERYRKASIEAASKEAAEQVQVDQVIEVEVESDSGDSNYN
ncbi:MAG: type II secretion system protein GspG [Chloroflexi bacterium]|nr:type II secretion system protein GspG [Chloroflexota bacterium]